MPIIKHNWFPVLFFSISILSKMWLNIENNSLTKHIDFFTSPFDNEKWLERNAFEFFLPGHPPELSDSFKLLLTNGSSYVFQINLVFKVYFDTFLIKIASILIKQFVYCMDLKLKLMFPYCIGQIFYKNLRILLALISNVF